MSNETNVEPTVQNNAQEIVTETPISAVQETVKEPANIKKFPKFFVKKDERVKIELDAVCNQSGEIVRIMPRGLMESSNGLFELFPFCLEFSKPTYFQISRYKSMCERKATDGSKFFDVFAFRNYILTWHLKEWNVVDESGEVVKLVVDKNNSDALSDETIALIYDTVPSILDAALARLESVLDLKLV